MLYFIFSVLSDSNNNNPGRSVNLPLFASSTMVKSCGMSLKRSVREEKHAQKGRSTMKTIVLLVELVKTLTQFPRPLRFFFFDLFYFYFSLISFYFLFYLFYLSFLFPLFLNRAFPNHKLIGSASCLSPSCSSLEWGVYYPS